MGSLSSLAAGTPLSRGAETSKFSKLDEKFHLLIYSLSGLDGHQGGIVVIDWSLIRLIQSLCSLKRGARCLRLHQSFLFITFNLPSVLSDIILPLSEEDRYSYQSIGSQSSGILEQTYLVDLHSLGPS